MIMIRTVRDEPLPFPEAARKERPATFPPPLTLDGRCTACGCGWARCETCGTWWYGTHTCEELAS
jgi:hypothetical protein